jgi:hypothetical protein
MVLGKRRLQLPSTFPPTIELRLEGNDVNFNCVTLRAKSGRMRKAYLKTKQDVAAVGPGLVWMLVPVPEAIDPESPLGRDALEHFSQPLDLLAV